MREQGGTLIRSFKAGLGKRDGFQRELPPLGRFAHTQQSPAEFLLDHGHFFGVGRGRDGVEAVQYTTRK